MAQMLSSTGITLNLTNVKGHSIQVQKSISNLKKPACASKRDLLELAALTVPTILH